MGAPVSGHGLEGEHDERQTTEAQPITDSDGQRFAGRQLDGTDVAAVGAGQIFKADPTVAQQQAGVTADADEVEKAEELFAQAFETYIKDGNAPTPRLAAAFEQL
jgi:hypothetical protein